VGDFPEIQKLAAVEVDPVSSQAAAAENGLTEKHE
jgi:hypothetical protein